ncbi:plectin-like [Sphaeramia orbicularis]|uniref:plectin-like n=1 Tax=Sphaeramia orbicularis TaxID=375764 RepID=UPI00117DCFD2|nr:plectin-like [Sphaeramia orbicularis]
MQNVTYANQLKSDMSGLMQSTTKLLDEKSLNKYKKSLKVVEESFPFYSGKSTTVAGIYVESSKKKISFLEASEKGFLAKTYALEFLEAQAATGSLTDLATGQTVSVLEAVERGIVEPGLKDKLLQAEKAVSGYVHAGKKMSVFQAMQERIVDRYTGKKILEVQLSSGGIINPESGVRVPVSVAIDKDLVNMETLQSLYDPVSNHKGFHNPTADRKCTTLKS